MKIAMVTGTAIFLLSLPVGAEDYRICLEQKIVTWQTVVEAAPPAADDDALPDDALPDDALPDDAATTTSRLEAHVAEGKSFRVKVIDGPRTRIFSGTLVKCEDGVARVERLHYANIVDTGILVTIDNMGTQEKIEHRDTVTTTLSCLLHGSVTIGGCQITRQDQSGPVKHTRSILTLMVVPESEDAEAGQ